MSVSDNTQAILLLTAHFSKAKNEAVKPLTLKEWGRFTGWLRGHSLTPGHLMTGRLDELLNGWSDREITLDRVEGLMHRGSALALALDKWLRAGLWVMTRSDSDYPTRFKQRLRADSPAVVFGCGNRALLNGGGLAVVGSRNATENDLAYSNDLGALAASTGYSVVSGGARGVDEASMLGALEEEGTVIGVLADSLMKACSGIKYRKHLMANNLVLISTFYPEAGFSVGHAMQRNKYIYCLSDAALVVHSGETGGTWNGAMENLKKQWVSLWVKRTNEKRAGNAAIVRAGATWVPENIGDIDLKALFSTCRGEKSPQEMPPTKTEQSMQVVKEDAEKYSSVKDIEFYDLFLSKAQLLCKDVPKTPDELAEALQIHKTQLNIWLKQAIADQKLKKLYKPVRYEWVTEQQGTLSISDQSVHVSKEDTKAFSSVENMEFYDLFLSKVRILCKDIPKTPDELAEALQIHKTQLNIWLKQAIADQKLKKLYKPVRYEWVTEQQGALSVSDQPVEVIKQDPKAYSSVEDIEFYDLFLSKVQVMCEDVPKTSDELAEALQIHKTQLNIWLKQAIADQKLKKLYKPVRYEWVTEQQDALSV